MSVRMEIKMNSMENEILRERLELAEERIGRIKEEQCLPEAFDAYFRRVSQFLTGMDEMPGQYEQSYLNPIYATQQLGEENGSFLSALYYEIYRMIPARGESELQEKVIRMELFLEVYGTFTYEWQENHRLPEYESLRQSFYWFAFDYADVAAEKYVKELAKGQRKESEADTSCLDSNSILYGFLPGRCGDRGCRKELLCDHDHREDIGIVLDKGYISRKLEVFKTALEQQKEGMQTNACTVGERQEQAAEQACDKAVTMSREQRKLWAEYCRQAESLWRAYCGEYGKEYCDAEKK